MSQKRCQKVTCILVSPGHVTCLLASHLFESCFPDLAQPLHPRLVSTFDAETRPDWPNDHCERSRSPGCCGRLRRCRECSRALVNTRETIVVDCFSTVLLLEKKLPDMEGCAIRSKPKGALTARRRSAKVSGMRRAQSTSASARDMRRSRRSCPLWPHATSQDSPLALFRVPGLRLRVGDPSEPSDASDPSNP